VVVHPLANRFELVFRGILKTNPGMIALAFPCQLTIKFKPVIQAGQVDREAECVFLRLVAGKLNRHSAFADVNRPGFEATGRTETVYGNLHGDAQLLAPLPLHQGANCSKARFCPLNRQRFMKDEMGPHIKAALQTDRRFYEHDSQSSLVDRGSFGSPKYVARFLRIASIHNYRLKALAGDHAESAIAAGTMVNLDLQIAEDPAEHTHRLFVRTHQQTLKIHGSSQDTDL
jgi:hypothetical protein